MFSNFIEGGCNQFAKAASISVSEYPGQKGFNPLVIYGGVGLGKTHLLQAICRTSIENHPSLRIYYTSCNGFMTQFLDAVQEGRLSSFRHRFRSYDLLVIDDIHQDFITGVSGNSIEGVEELLKTPGVGSGFRILFFFCAHVVHFIGIR
jgi:chromosomal replication initiation ATPase DnaA